MTAVKTETKTGPTRMVELKQKGKLEISPTLAAMITELHEVGGSNEWSGILVYRVLNGDINNPERFHAVAEGFFPMDMGSGAYTEYEPDESIIDIYTHFPRLDPEKNVRQDWRLGQIHTHHNMGAFFSGTDDGELKDNAGKYPYYLSLIVDTKGTYKAKVAILAKQRVKSNTSLRWNEGKKWRTFLEKKDEEQDVLVTFYVDVTMQTPDWYKERVKIINRSTKGSGYTKPYNNSNNNSGASNSNAKEGWRGGPQSNIGFRQSNKEEKKSNAPAGLLKADKQKLWERVKEKAMKLLNFEGTQYLGRKEWYHMLAFMDAALRDEDERRTHITAIISRIDEWTVANFEPEFHAGCDEETILETLISSIKVYSVKNKFATALVEDLQSYFNAVYKDGNITKITNRPTGTDPQGKSFDETLDEMEREEKRDAISHSEALAKYYEGYDFGNGE